MFVRIVWHGRAGPKTVRSMRRPEIGGRRDANDLGVPVPDFAKMTRGLFDRQD